MYEDERPVSRLRRLEDYLGNVFWFHYKWYYLAGVFLAALLLMSLVSFATRVEYDWTVVYAHAGEADPAGRARVRALVEESGVDVNGNGRVQADVREASAADGESALFAYLYRPEYLVYVLDGETAALYRSLGYFDTEKRLADGALYAAVRDAPVKPYTLADFEGYNYTQAQIDESNAYRVETHEALAAQARAIVERLA